MSMAIFADLALLHLTMVMATPLIIACLGETLIERSGVLNIGIEGMVTFGAVVGFLGAFQTGSLLVGCLLGMAAGSMLAVLLGVFAIDLRANQIVVGLGLFVFGFGISPLMYRLVFGIVQSPPQIVTLPTMPLPVLGSIPIVGPILFQHNVLVYVAYMLVLVVWFFLFHMPLGLRLRACGENPRATDALGIEVKRLRYGACAVGGLFLGLAGAYLPLVITGTFTDNIVNGRGWLALMLVIFGRWHPCWAFLGAILFAYVDAFQFKVSALPSLAHMIPPQFLQMLPYLFAIIVLVQVSRDAEAPQALAHPYDREARD